MNREWAQQSSPAVGDLQLGYGVGTLGFDSLLAAAGALPSPIVIRPCRDTAMLRLMGDIFSLE